MHSAAPPVRMESTRANVHRTAANTHGVAFTSDLTGQPQSSLEKTFGVPFSRPPCQMGFCRSSSAAPDITPRRTAEARRVIGRDRSASLTIALRPATAHVATQRWKLAWKHAWRQLRIIKQRQRELTSLVSSALQAKGSFDFSAVGRRLDVCSSTEAAPSRAERDAFFVAAAERLRARSSDEDFGALPAKLHAWLHSSGGQQFLSEQASILESLERPGASAEEIAWAVRVVQLENREKVPQILQKAVGADELTPMMERVLIAACPRHAWSALASMMTIDDEVLLEQPNLAAAIDGFSTAMQGVQNAASASWRRAAVEAELWRTLGRLPLTQVVPDAFIESGVPLEQLTSVSLMLEQAHEREETTWASAPAGEYVRCLRHDTKQIVGATQLQLSARLSARHSSMMPSSSSSRVGASIGLCLRLWVQRSIAFAFCCA